jgi:hypothetical protein
VLALIGRARRRLRAIDVLQAGAAGAAAGAGVLVALSLAGIGAQPAMLGALSAGLTGGFAAAAAGWRRWTAAAVAARLESACGTLDNLLITSVQMSTRPGRVLPFIREAVATQAASRLRSVDLSCAIPAARAIQLLVMTVTGAGLLMWTAARPDEGGTGRSGLRTPAAGASP